MIGVFPKNRTRMRVIGILYENPGINLSELIAKSKTSPNIVLDYVNILVGNGVLTEKRIGGRKKTHIRQFFPDLQSDIGRMVFSLVEMEKKKKFLGKYPKMKPFCSQLSELLKNRVNFCLVYGSYARLAAEETSDLDLLIVGNVGKELKTRMSEIFVTFSAELSSVLETQEQFRKNLPKPLHQSILKEHVILFGEQEFLKAVQVIVGR